jgi:lysophospholipase L1-like esterase
MAKEQQTSPGVRPVDDGWQSLWRSFAIVGCTICTLLVLIVLVELTARAVGLFLSDPYTDPNKVRSSSPVYAEYSWAPDFWHEENLRASSPRPYFPFLLWGVPKWQGKYVNNDSGELRGFLRRTVNPPCAKSPRKLWIFGGSTVYGTAVPDWATLPSYLSQDLNLAGDTCTVIFNLGVEGYVSTQELILLTEQLKAGQRPDIVIFYDGVNDAATAQPGPGPPEPHFYYEMVKGRIEGSWQGRFDFLRKSSAVRLAEMIKRSFRQEHSVPLSPEILHAKVAATLDNYEANLGLAKALGRVYGFKLYCFWQPSLYYGHKPRTAFEQELPDVNPTDMARNPWSLLIAGAYQEAEIRATQNGDFVFMGGLFDTTSNPIYLDSAHLGPRGNELAAQAIATYVKEHP